MMYFFSKFKRKSILSTVLDIVDKIFQVDHHINELSSMPIKPIYFWRVSNIIILLNTIMILNSYGQNLLPMLERGNLWSQITTNYPYGAFHTEETKNTYWFKVGTDTSINGKICKIILSANDSLATDWRFAFILREDSSKIFYFYYEEEELLYDFNLELNDSIVTNIGGGYRVSKLISKKDTLIGNKLRKKYLLANYWLGFNEITFPETWIEGIGSLFGLQRSSCFGITPCYIVEDLSCFYHNDTLIYQNCPVCNCYIVVASTDKLSDIEGLKIIPNPANEFLEIKSPSILIKFEIFNYYGILIEEGLINSFSKNVDISKLIPGLYIIKVYDSKKLVSSKKIIVE